ncbi:uncharacterized protein VP01_1728g2 [Puccinia sorghi]|uniref:DUF8040 domain-containing protein n=1 Tax=Puccinia sorghi TaxID=27349 RepID=A0A0L6VFD7_9BASI|nr:uncharacterized protein VP01_1728g2 [Puccinia sorghi]
MNFHYDTKVKVFILLSKKLEKLDYRPASKMLHMNEQLSILIYIFGNGTTNCQNQDRFQHSREKVSCFLKHVIQMPCRLGPTYISEPHVNSTHQTIKSNPKYSPFYDWCLVYAHDAPMLQHLRGNTFIIPQGCFYLADAGVESL